MEKNYLAQVDLGGRFEGIGPLGDTWNFGRNIERTTTLFGTVMSIIIGFLTVVAGLWFVFQFLIGAISWISAGGDKNKVAEAQAKITQGIIGLVVVISAIFLIDLIGSLFGLDILTPGDFILSVWE